MRRRLVTMRVSRELLTEMFALGANRDIVDMNMDLPTDSVVFSILDGEAPDSAENLEPVVYKTGNCEVRLEPHYS